MTPAGFPHSDIHGSTLESSSPWLFAGFHVLHRLLVPRHPPCALCSLTSLRFAALSGRKGRLFSRRKPPSVGSSSRVLSSPTNCLVPCRVPLVLTRGSPHIFCSRLTLTSCVLVKSETQLSTEIVLLGSVTNSRRNVIGDLPVVLFVSSSLRQQSSDDWAWRIAGSNRWPQACKARALPAELIPQSTPMSK
jgi:LSD1 subclass zinc finger protein